MSLLIIGLFLTTACNSDSNTEENSDMEVDSTDMVQDPNAPVPTTVSNEDLVTFMEIMTSLQPAGEAAQREMMDAVSSENMSVDEYMMIEQSKMNPEADIPAADMAKYEKASAKIEKIQANNKTKMEKMIEDKGMSVQKYEAILGAVQSNPAMMDQIMQIMEEKEAEQQ